MPEGYFENLTSEVMGKLPEKEGPAFEEVKQPTMWIRMKPLLYMAAMFIGAALIIRVASSNHQRQLPVIISLQMKQRQKWFRMNILM